MRERIERLGKTYVTLIADGKRLKKIGLSKWLREQEARAKTGFCYVDLRPPKARRQSQNPKGRRGH